MHSMSDHVILAPPDLSGLLGAAALCRRLWKSDPGLLWPHELSRRVAALADEPSAAPVSIVDLVPADSIETLLIPSLERLVDRGLRAVWYYGRDEAAPALRSLRGLVDLHYEAGARTWRLVCAEQDRQFVDFAEAIEGGIDEGGRRWQLFLHALTTSWDWTRIYGSLEMLRELRQVAEGDVAWARGQLAEAQRIDAVVTQAEVRELAGARVALITDPAVPARVRPEIFRALRRDVDALAFVGGPGRLVIIATGAGRSPAFLRALSADPALTIGSLAASRADIVWRPGRVPESVVHLFGRRIFDDIEGHPPVPESARIAHATDERIAKGLHPSRLHHGDRATLLEGILNHAREERTRGPSTSS
jgi:hypothetical protein